MADRNQHNYCVIMAGGIGSRFWPMSKTTRPKQFIDILGTGRTLIQQTFDRLAKIAPVENIFIVTHEDYIGLVKEQLPSIPSENILSEPFRKNTAPCTAYASYKIGLKDPEAAIVMAPADHLILKEDVFVKAINSCLTKSREDDSLVTLGIKPTRPDTGYGYIQFEEGTGAKHDIRIKKVKTFTEKPNLEIARSFLESGDFLWNSGIFAFTYKAISKAFEDYMPELSSAFTEASTSFYTENEGQVIKSLYNTCSSISIDYGIMEKADNVYVRASVIGWSDLGTWGSLYTHLDHDDKGNAVKGGKVLLYESNDCLIRLDNNKLAVIQGLQEYIVVESDNTLLICKKEDEQKIRGYVSDIKEKFPEIKG